MSTVTVQQAEATLAAARAEADALARAQACIRIAELAAEGARLKAEFAPLREQILRAQHERQRLHLLLRDARSQVLAYSAPLDPLSFPSAKDHAEQARQLTCWKARQKELLDANAANEERMSMDVMRHANRLTQRLESLQQEISNLTAVAEGRRPGEIKGGLSLVSEDFLGSTQMPARHST